MCRPGTIHKLSQLGTLITAVYQFCRSLLNFSSKSQKQHKKTRTAFRLLRSKKPQRHSRATGDNGQRGNTAFAATKPPPPARAKGGLVAALSRRIRRNRRNRRHHLRACNLCRIWPGAAAPANFATAAERVLPRCGYSMEGGRRGGRREGEGGGRRGAGGGTFFKVLHF